MLKSQDELIRKDGKFYHFNLVKWILTKRLTRSLQQIVITPDALDDLEKNKEPNLLKSIPTKLQWTTSTNLTQNSVKGIKNLEHQGNDDRSHTSNDNGTSKCKNEGSDREERVNFMQLKNR